jgi:hypothetical protein
MSQPFDSVQVNAGSTDKEQGAVLANPPNLPIGQGQGLAKCLRCRSWRSKVKRLLRAKLIGTALEDELAALAGENAQLQSA